MDNNERLRTAALHYADLGYKVFPCVAHAKNPLTKHGCKDATTDTDQIEAWWDQWPDANVAIATEGLLVIDVDGKDNPWSGDLPECPLSLTPNGGRHYILRQPEGRQYGNTAGKLAPKVDTRGDGGYILVPPSELAGGNQYFWQEPINGSTPVVPSWVVELLDRIGSGDGSSVTDLPAVIPLGIQDDSMTKYAGYFRRAGMSESEMLSCMEVLNGSRFQPPIAPKDLRRIAGSIAKHEPDQFTTANLENHWQQMTAELDKDRPADPGPFPEKLMRVPGFISDVIEFNLETAHRPQPVLALAGALALQAVLAGRKVCDAFGNRTNVYILGIAASGQGKEHARKINKKVLFESENGDLEGPEDFASDSGLLKAVADSKSTLFQVDELGKMLQTVKDSRQSHLYNITRLLLQLYSSANTHFKGKAYADTKNRVEINQPCAVLYGTSVPENFYKSMTTDSLSDGFLSRMLVFESGEWVKSRLAEEKKLPTAIVKQAAYWGKQTPGGNLGDENPKPKLVTASGDAKEVVDNLIERTEQQAEHGSHITQAMLSRIVEKASRLALIYACSRSPRRPVIDGEAMQWACDLAEYLTQRILYAATDWVADSEFDKLQKEIIRQLKEAGGSLNRSKLYAKTRHISRQLRQNLIQNLVETGQIYEKTASTGGRPSTTFHLNRGGRSHG